MANPNYSLGSDHHLYISVNDTATPTALVAFDGRPGDAGVTIHYNNAEWFLYDNIRDVDESGSPTSVDITTRDTARRGVIARVNVATDMTMGVQVLYKPQIGATINDKIFRMLMKANINRTEFAAMDLDQAGTEQGALGLSANWNVAYTKNKPVQGVVICTFNMTVSSFPTHIVAGATDFTFTEV